MISKKSKHIAKRKKFIKRKMIVINIVVHNVEDHATYIMDDIDT